MRYENEQAGRYYEAWATNDLFGPCVVRVWGRIGTERGQLRSYSMRDEREALQSLRMIEKQRLRRGYAVRLRGASMAVPTHSVAGQQAQ